MFPSRHKAETWARGLPGEEDQGVKRHIAMVRFVVKMAHKDMDARKIMDLLTKRLEKSGYWA